MSKDSLNAALMLLADIREAVGDPEGKLMQGELVERCRGLQDKINQLEKKEAKTFRLAYILKVELDKALLKIRRLEKKLK